jgi:GT2 family glycosyltransferase
MAPMLEKDGKPPGAAASPQPDAVSAGPPEGYSRERFEELESRLRSTERGLQLALAELSRMHSSRMWRVASAYWRVLEWTRLLRRRLFHPLDAARAAAPRMLPIGFRLGLVRVLRWFRRDARPDTVGWSPAGEPSPAEDRARPSLICLPVIDWEFRTQRPQHLLSRLAGRGWRVYYAALNPAAGEGGVLVRDEPIAPGIREVRLPSGRELDPYRDRLDPDARDRMEAAVREFAAGARIHDAAVLCHLPFWSPLADALRRSLGWPVVYDMMDLHGGFSSNAPGMVGEEKDLVAGADLVVVTSAALEDSARRRAKRVVRIPNGCDAGFWGRAWEPVLDGDIPHPIIGYFGAISEWFDVDLVRDLALRRRTWSFALIGSTWGASVEGLRVLPNVHLLGEVPYERLPALAAAFDVGIIPFKDSELTRATDPVKLYEMLALGLDVVASPLPEIVRLGDLVRQAATADEFLSAIQSALVERGDERAAARRRSFARDNDWDARADRFDESLRECFPLVSIVVVTYNNLPLTRMCLASIRARTEYPRYEIVVVDNGSGDGTAEYLRQVAAESLDTKVILNSENRGFAAANNQGLAVARGEILCLLNNDTVVARGWLSSLVRALRLNPSWGLVGPVTNAIGNEARVNVDYEDIEEMPEWAARWVVERRGRSFAIPMLALYCAAMRRDVWEAVGELDERFGVGMFEDDDYCRRIRRAGYELRCVEDAFVHHWQRASFRLLGEQQYQDVLERNRALFREKWRS